MIDLKAVRANPEAMQENIQKRNLKVDLDAFLEMDKKLIELNQKLDEIRATKNSFSKLIPTLSKEEKEVKLVEMKAL
jgi:seryl-tRNA synthetase